MNGIAPAKGSLPVLQYCVPSQLAVDPLYQRELDGASRRLIGEIARGWDWNLFQPLVVARRHDGSMYVVDGQHRLEAARMRGDIGQLPCVIFHPGDAADEAQVFVELNQRRRPLTAYALYNGALVAGDEHALAIDSALREAGLSFSGAADAANLKPGQLNNVGSVRKWHARHGTDRLRTVFAAISRNYRGEVIRISGALFQGIGTIVIEQGAGLSLHLLVDILDRPQDEWLADFRKRAATNGVGIQAAAVAVLRDAYAEAIREMDEAA